MTPGSVLISTGEASGDTVGAELLLEMRSRGFRGDAYAIGGRRLSEAGATILEDSRRWAAMGIVQSLRVYPRVLAGFKRVKRKVREAPPRLVITIDFGAFNVPLCRFAKRHGCSTLYFMPPGSWRRDTQGADLSEIADRIATPFEWSAELLRKSGAQAEWVGHPSAQLADRAPYTERDRLAVLPGSRSHEIHENLAGIVPALRILGDAVPPVAVIVAPTADETSLREIWRRHGGPEAEFVPGPSYETLKRSVAAVVCSGTATLDAAVCHTPMVVVYRLTPLMALEGRLLGLHKKVKMIAMPSILLGRLAFPELIHRQASPLAISERLLPLLTNTPERRTQLGAFEELSRLLGPRDAISRTATLALETLGVG